MRVPFDFPSTRSKTLVGQTFTHSPSPLHLSSSISTVVAASYFLIAMILLRFLLVLLFQIKDFGSSGEINHNIQTFYYGVAATLQSYLFFTIKMEYFLILCQFSILLDNDLLSINSSRIISLLDFFSSEIINTSSILSLSIHVPQSSFDFFNIFPKPGEKSSVMNYHRPSKCMMEVIYMFFF